MPRELPSPQAGSGTPFPYTSGGFATSGVIHDKRAVLLRLSVTNKNAAAMYLQLFDAAAVPADATVPLMSIPVPLSGFVNQPFGEYGRLFTTGIAWALSTTIATKTLAAADALVEATVIKGGNN